MNTNQQMQQTNKAKPSNRQANYQLGQLHCLLEQQRILNECADGEKTMLQGEKML
jgi:hypothetical protein